MHIVVDGSKDERASHSYHRPVVVFAESGDDNEHWLGEVIDYLSSHVHINILIVMVSLASLLKEGVPATSVSPVSLDVFGAVSELEPEACRPEAFLERLVCVAPFVRMQGKGKEISDEACAAVRISSCVG